MKMQDAGVGAAREWRGGGGEGDGNESEDA
jgi:hypothetical protein